ncbi:MAG: STAS/SEC14 domain-containing protein [Pelagimonas sp.]|jgi:hypothetical protein|nr:STAS/SEC14 domain-containing protein [Pelagimonas sp.]
MPITYEEFPETKSIEFTYRGMLTVEDYQGLVEPLVRMIERFGDVNVVDVVDSFAGFDDALYDAFSPKDTDLLKHIKRLAVVSDLGWVCPIMSHAPEDLIVNIRSFRRDQHEIARGWARCCHETAGLASAMARRALIAC